MERNIINEQDDFLRHTVEDINDEIRTETTREPECYEDEVPECKRTEDDIKYHAINDHNIVQPEYVNEEEVKMDAMNINVKEKQKELKKFSITAKSGFTETKLISHCLAKFLLQHTDDMLPIKIQRTEESPFEEDFPIIIEGLFAFSYKSKIICCTAPGGSFVFDCNDGFVLNDFKEKFNYYLKYKNPIRGRMISIEPTDGMDISFKIENISSITYDDLILPEGLKNDIYDNTILHLKELEGSNGIILHGPPGTGKTMACQAIISEANKLGYSICYTTFNLNFPRIDIIVEQYLGPSIVIFEDIDSFGYDRDKGRNFGLSNFLQFVNGLSEKKEKYALIATTNNIEALDNAIKNRPIRFNRKYHISYPSHEEINKLIDLYFKNTKISDDLKELCHQKEFTGSHIKEIRRTVNMLLKKNGASFDGIFRKAVDIVKENFCTDITKAIL